MSPPRPRMHWAVDLLLSLVVLLSTGVVLYVGAVVLALSMVGSQDQPPVPVWLVVAGLTLIVLAGWTARGCWRLGYRIAPCVAVAAPFLWPPGLVVAADLFS